MAFAAYLGGSRHRIPVATHQREPALLNPGQDVVWRVVGTICKWSVAAQASKGNQVLITHKQNKSVNFFFFLLLIHTRMLDTFLS